MCACERAIDGLLSKVVTHTNTPATSTYKCQNATETEVHRLQVLSAVFKCVCVRCACVCLCVHVRVCVCVCVNVQTLQSVRSEPYVA